MYRLQRSFIVNRVANRLLSDRDYYAWATIFLSQPTLAKRIPFKKVVIIESKIGANRLLVRDKKTGARSYVTGTGKESVNSEVKVGSRGQITQAMLELAIKFILKGRTRPI